MSTKREKDRKELTGIVSRAFLVTIPSLTKGLALSLFEAMSCGKAVAASKFPGIEDVVVDGKNGLLVLRLESPIISRIHLEASGVSQAGNNSGHRARRLTVQEDDWST